MEYPRVGEAFYLRVRSCWAWERRHPRQRAAEIAWERVTPFQGCLAAGLDKWLEVQVDTLTNEDPAAWRIDDMAVATWTIDALAACKAKAGGGDEATESRFTKYMAQWRRHVLRAGRECPPAGQAGLIAAPDSSSFPRSISGSGNPTRVSTFAFAAGFPLSAPLGGNDDRRLEALSAPDCA